jgi:drug/metabolite transporter (DMT)-like permease
MTDSKQQSPLPWEREATYVGAWFAIGGIFAFLAWGIADFFLPERDLEWAKWSFVGAGLAGLAALTWVVARALYG